MALELQRNAFAPEFPYLSSMKINKLKDLNIYRRSVMHRFCAFSWLAVFITVWGSTPSFAEYQLQIAVTGNLQGAIRECQCPSGQPGGLARRMSAFRELRNQNPNIVSIDCGKILGKNTGQQEINLLAELYTELNYSFIGLCSVDARKLIKQLQSHQINSALSFYPPAVKTLFPVSSDSSFTLRCIQLEDLVTELDNDNFNKGHVMTIVVHNLSLEQLERSITNHLIEDVLIPYPRVATIADLIILGCSDRVNPGVELFSYSFDNSNLNTNLKQEIHESAFLLVQPGIFGEYIVVLNMTISDSAELEDYTWETIPTESVSPDSASHVRINHLYQEIRED